MRNILRLIVIIVLVVYFILYYEKQENKETFLPIATETQSVTAESEIIIETTEIITTQIPVTTEIKTQEILPTTKIPNLISKKVIIEEVPFYMQNDIAINGCESVATVSALQYLGVDISINEFIDNYLETRYMYKGDDGNLISFNPEEYYVNSPYAKNGWYCFDKVIEKSVSKFLDFDAYEIVNYTGCELEVLKTDCIDKGIPVVVWTTVNMKTPRKSVNTVWKLEDGSEYVPYVNLHCVVLVGYDDNYYYFNDSLKGKEWFFKKEDVEKVYAGMGKRAIAFRKKVSKDQGMEKNRDESTY